MKRLLGVFMSFFLWTSIAIGQTGFSFWNDIPAAQISLPRGAYPPLQATHYRSLELDFERAANYLRRAPQEGEGGGLVFHLPLPNGEMEAFITEESPVMSPELGKKFPEIRTFIARGAKHRDWTARLDFGPDGFHAAIRTSEGLVYIDPLARGLTHYYTSYFTKDLQWPENMDMPRCGLSDEEIRIAKEIIPLTETQPTTSSFLRLCS